MSPISISDFPAFFSEVWNGHEPFAWQEELLELVVSNGRWPDLVDIPTGLGKTTAIDVALFALAIETSSVEDRSRWVHPHRIVMVVDRRVIVDQAHDRALHLASKLFSAPDGSMAARVRDTLATRTAPRSEAERSVRPPLLTSVLRGGIVRDEEWARRPDVPAVLASTVDQVGSRLLFRGYGLSTSARPIHAGLLSSDTLYLLDEVHLAQPFAETLAAVQRLKKVQQSEALPTRLGIVQLSATPVMPAETRFPATPLPRPEASPESVRGNGRDAIVARRTGNAKPADLQVVKVPVDAAKANQVFAKAVAMEVERRQAGTSRIAVMVNRVDTARRVASILRDRASKDDRFDVVLLTGRMRPADRDSTLNDPGSTTGRTLTTRLAPGSRDVDERPVVVVATQSLEAGADFDFDLLVTECASLDALRQRFGRVDRDGQRWAHGTVSRSAVLCRSTDADGKAPDPVYGMALHETWKWLESQDEVDFAYRAMATPPDDLVGSLVSPRVEAPLLAPSHIDRWCQTSEREVSAEPEVAQWLHGVDSTNEIADVQLVWRAGLDDALFRWHSSASEQDLPSPSELGVLVSELLDAVPPLAAETLAVPIGEARRWLRSGEGDPALSDAPMNTEVGFDRDQNRQARLVARWSGDGVEMISPEQIRPGDTIVVPNAAGGIASGNWDPSSTDEVHDLSRSLSLSTRGVGVALLSPGACEAIGAAWPDPDELFLLKATERRAVIGEFVERHRSALGLGDHQFSTWRDLPVSTHVDDDGLIRRSFLVTARVLQTTSPEDDLATDASDDSLSLIGKPIRLHHHLQGVGHHAAAFAAALGWSEPLVRALRLAGEVHDAGKADSRFQLILSEGDPSAPLLAKSANRTGDPSGRRASRRAAGYPAGTRHELMSLALLDGYLDDAVDDVDLVKHLVATHHGWGRYRFRPVNDHRPEEVSVAVETSTGPLDLRAPSDHGLEQLGSGHDERFWSLTRRYGWWALAQMEAVLRLADHHRSHLEQAGEVEHDAFAQGELS